MPWKQLFCLQMKFDDNKIFDLLFSNTFIVTKLESILYQAG